MSNSNHSSSLTLVYNSHSHPQTDPDILWNKRKMGHMVLNEKYDVSSLLYFLVLMNENNFAS